MKNYKVKTLRPFKDATENVDRVANEEFYCTEERCKVLIEHNVVELLQIEIDEKDLKEYDIDNKEGLLTEEEIKELKTNEVVDVIVNKEFEEKPKKKNNKKK